MNLLTFSKNTLEAITKYDEEVNTEPLDAQIKFADIWDECHMKLKYTYKVDGLKLTGEGFELGEATSTECINAATLARFNTGKDVYFYHHSEFTLFGFLNQEFINLMEPEVSRLIKSYNSYCSQYLNKHNLKIV